VYGLSVSMVCDFYKDKNLCAVLLVIGFGGKMFYL
jgi:hypothetical protein